MRTLAFLIVTLLLTACQPAPKAVAPDPDDALFDDLDPAKDQIKLVLKDPDSAKYQNVSAFKTLIGGKTVYAFCGEVNAHNGFAGYAGYQRFVATSRLAQIESQHSDFDKVWEVLCAERVKSVVF